MFDMRIIAHIFWRASIQSRRSRYVQ